jgi:hypothetical protein
VVCKGDHGVGRGYRTSLASPMRPCPGAKTGLLCSRGAPAPPAPHDGIGARRLRHQRGMSQQLGHPTSGPNVAQDRGLMMPCAYEPRPPAYEPDSMGPRGGWAKQGRATLSVLRSKCTSHNANSRQVLTNVSGWGVRESKGFPSVSSKPLSVVVDEDMQSIGRKAVFIKPFAARPDGRRRPHQTD